MYVPKKQSTKQQSPTHGDFLFLSTRTMNITIINDCRDENAVGRQTTRASALLGGPTSFIGVRSDLEAAGNLVDALDAYGSAPGVVLVNVAPRHGLAKKWPNGTPFGFFRYQNVIVVASTDGSTLSLVKKLGLVKEVYVLDIPTVVARFVAEQVISSAEAQYIVSTQFRSYEFLPRVAAYLLTHATIESEARLIEAFADASAAVWWVDNFGNCKTTLLQREVPKGGLIATRFGNLAYFERLKDVPDSTTAFVAGSSGTASSRFLEIVAQGESAAKLLTVESGDTLF